MTDDIAAIAALADAQPEAIDISGLIAPPIHPRFVAWLDKQPDKVRAAIAEKWTETGTQADIAPGPIGAGARKTRVLEFCAAEFGYDFTA